MALFKLVKKVALKIDEKKGADTVLKLISPLPDVEKCKRILFVGPHPDDIEIGCGATLDKFVKAGKEVMMLVCTDGGAGIESDKVTPEQIAETRLNEAKNAASLLGVAQFDNIMFPDGGDYQEWALAKEIAKRIYAFDPEAVFCPDPNLPSETHPDHLRCARAVCDALFIASYYHIARRNGLDFEFDKLRHSHILAYYFTARPNTFVEVTTQNEEQRYAAIKKHVSQMPGLSAQGIDLYLSLRDKHIGEQCGVDTAEGYFVMAPMHQHCVSETNNW